MSDRSGGFTLVEVIVAIVVLGAGLAGLLTAFNTAGRASADPMVHKQMLSLAEGMLEEILLMPYESGPGVINPAGCSRVEADDIGDYDGYGPGNGCGQARDLEGNPIAALAGYAIGVSVRKDATLGGLASDVAKITVTVSRGGESLSLVGYRTNYAKAVP